MLPTATKPGYRGPVTATARIVPPYLYKVVWSIAIHGPLTASEIADEHNLPEQSVYFIWTPQTTANRMRSLIKLGLIERDPDGFYVLTEYGRGWVTTGAEA